MPYEFYRLIHLIGIFGTFTALGGLIIGSTLGWGDTGLRKGLVAIHGAAMLLLLVAGFGMLAKLDASWPLPGWIWGKLVLWVVLGGLVVPMRRMPQPKLWLVVVPLLGLGTAWLALYKPF